MVEKILSNLATVWELFKALPLMGGGFIVWVKAIPDLIRLIKEVIMVVHLVDDYFGRWQKTKDFKEAIVKARTTGDTSDLEKLFKGG